MANIAMIIPFQNFRDEELLVPKEHFESKGHVVVVASTRTGDAHGVRGAVVAVDKTLSELAAALAEYGAVVFVGGPGTPSIRREEAVLKIAREAAAANKVVAAICWATTTLAKAGVLKGKQATVWFGPDSEYGMNTDKVLEKFGAAYVAQPVVVDGRFVTADGPAHAKKFAEEIEKLL
jgi:protease I